MTQHVQSQFHAEEIAVQTRVGVAESVARYGNDFIRQAMPDQHREFFSELPFVILGLVDKHGFPWAFPHFKDQTSETEGSDTFIFSPDNTKLRLAGRPNLAQALDLDFRHGKKVGMLGIQLHTRRRNRMNGILETIDDNGFSIQVEQSFGNCPQYIQARKLDWKSNQEKHTSFDNLELKNKIDAKVKMFIEQADTFFIASRTKHFSDDVRSGIDISHRGGKPGFVKVEGNRLSYPDFRGNHFFNTLGNIESDGRVGLFFPDFSNGDGIFVSGHANVIWDQKAASEFAGAERIVEIEIAQVMSVASLMPMTANELEFSPALEQTGVWNSNKRTLNDYNAFRIINKQKESDSITSFYLAPVNGADTQDYIPGQFLPIGLQTARSDKSVFRSYTLSRAPIQGSYRISVKREEHGLVSKLLHDDLQIGDSILTGVPTGQFTVEENDHAIVFLSSGVGITPMIAMLEGLVREFQSGKPVRPVWFIHGTQNSQSQAFASELEKLARQYKWLHVHRVFSRPLDKDEIDNNYDSAGRISVELLKRILPFDQYDFYLCGSEAFMRDIYADLTGMGVAKANIFYEFFGAGSIDKTQEGKQSEVAKTAQVRFASTGKTAKWTQEDGTLLEFAERQGLNPSFGCRSGSCGLCACKISSGKVSYTQKPTAATATDEILLCSAMPAADSSDITIEV